MNNLEDTIRKMLWRIFFPVNEDPCRSEIVYRGPGKCIRVDLLPNISGKIDSIEICVSMESKFLDKKPSWRETTLIDVNGFEKYSRIGLADFNSIVYNVVRYVRILWGRHNND